MCALDGSATWRFMSPVSCMDLTPPSRKSETEMVSLMTTCTLGKGRQIKPDGKKWGLDLPFRGYRWETAPCIFLNLGRWFDRDGRRRAGHVFDGEDFATECIQQFCLSRFLAPELHTTCLEIRRARCCGRCRRRRARSRRIGSLVSRDGGITRRTTPEVGTTPATTSQSGGTLLLFSTLHLELTGTAFQFLFCLCFFVLWVRHDVSALPLACLEDVTRLTRAMISCIFSSCDSISSTLRTCIRLTCSR